MEEKLLPIKKVEEYVGFTKSKIYELSKNGDFPKSIKVGGSTLWKYTDIQKWIKRQISKHKEDLLEVKTA